MVDKRDANVLAGNDFVGKRNGVFDTRLAYFFRSDAFGDVCLVFNVVLSLIANANATESESILVGEINLEEVVGEGSAVGWSKFSLNVAAIFSIWQTECYRAIVALRCIEAACAVSHEDVAHLNGDVAPLHC